MKAFVNHIQEYHRSYNQMIHLSVRHKLSVDRESLYISVTQLYTEDHISYLYYA